SLEDFVLDSVTKESKLMCGDGASAHTVTGKELAEIVKRISQARRLRMQLDKRADRRIVAEFADVQLSEADLRDREKLERIEAKVMAEVSRRHGELGQAAGEYKQDSEHGTWEIRFTGGQHGVRRHTVISADLVRSPEFVELRKIAAELKGTLVQPLRL